MTILIESLGSFNFTHKLNFKYVHVYTCTDASPAERDELLLKKIEQCRYIFDFSDPMSDLRAKEVKRAALTEILDHVTVTPAALKDIAYPSLVQMVGNNHTSHVLDHKHQPYSVWLYQKSLCI